MTSDQISKSLQIGANLGILLGLVLVAIQIHEAMSILCKSINAENYRQNIVRLQRWLMICLALKHSRLSQQKKKD